MDIQAIGVFRETSPSGTGPSIHDSVNKIGPEDREAVAAYLEAGIMIGAVPGLERDVLGGPEYLLRASLMTDGRRVWRWGLSHYVRHYGVPVPDEVIARARRGERPGELSPDEDAAVNAWITAEARRPSM